MRLFPGWFRESRHRWEIIGVALAAYAMVPFLWWDHTQGQAKSTYSLGELIGVTAFLVFVPIVLMGLAWVDVCAVRKARARVFAEAAERAGNVKPGVRVVEDLHEPNRAAARRKGPRCMGCFFSIGGTLLGWRYPHNLIEGIEYSTLLLAVPVVLLGLMLIAFPDSRWAQHAFANLEGRGPS